MGSWLRMILFVIGSRTRQLVRKGLSVSEPIGTSNWSASRQQKSGDGEFKRGFGQVR
jgi:hypothetical protein